MSTHTDARSVWDALVAASKKARGPFYTRYVNRNAAIPLTLLFWKLGLHPNAVSVLSFVTTHTALALLVVMGPSVPVAVAVYLLLVLGFIMDSCDGQLARVSGRTSRLGEWLDHSLDVMKVINVNLALSYTMLAAALGAGEALGPVYAAAALNLLFQPAHFFVLNMKTKILGGGKVVSQLARKGAIGIGGRVVSNGADYGLFMMFFLLLPWQEVFVPVYLGYGVFYALIFSFHFVRASMVIAKAPQGSAAPAAPPAPPARTESERADAPAPTR